MPLSENPYLFPMPSLESLSTQELQALMVQKLETANLDVDGTDQVTPEAQDYARDIVAQCRDLLLQRGCTFGAQEQARRAFLRWTASPLFLNTERLPQEVELREKEARMRKEQTEHMHRQEQRLYDLVGATPAPWGAHWLGLSLSLELVTAEEVAQEGCTIAALFEEVVRQDLAPTSSWQRDEQLRYFREGHHLRYHSTQFRIKVEPNPELWRLLARAYQEFPSLHCVLQDGSSNLGVTQGLRAALALGGYFAASAQSSTSSCGAKPEGPLRSALKRWSRWTFPAAA